MAAVDEHGELDARGPAVVEKRLDRGADRAARIEDVIDEHDGAAVEREVELRRADERLRGERVQVELMEVDEIDRVLLVSEREEVER